MLQTENSGALTDTADMLLFTPAYIHNGGLLKLDPFRLDDMILLKSDGMPTYNFATERRMPST